jgi:hypothetical protein
VRVVVLVGETGTTGAHEAKIEATNITVVTAFVFTPMPPKELPIDYRFMRREMADVHVEETGGRRRIRS